MRLTESNSNPMGIVHVLGLAALATVIVLWLRVDATNLIEFVNNSLWAEDGVVFINEAEEYGLRSIWMPYAGYLHVYPRIFALIATQLNLGYTPWIFMVGFTLAVWTMMFLIVQGMLELDCHPMAIFLVAVLLSIQPNHGQIFFTLTNSQWFFGVGLCVLVSVSRLYSSSHLYTFLGALLSLTGPFSVLLFPVLLVRFYIDRDRPRALILPLVMALCVGIQVYFIVSSGRGGGDLSDNWRGWLVVLIDSATFGRQNMLVVALSIAMWALLMRSLFVTWRYRLGEEKNYVTTALLLLAAGTLMYAGSLWGFKDSPWGLNPITGNARYFFSPYAMIVLSMLVLYRMAPGSTASVIFLFGTISIIEFRAVARPDMQFPSFAAFSQVRSDIVAPITPTIPEYPGWYFERNDTESGRYRQTVHTYTASDLGRFIESESSKLVFDLMNICPNSEHIGLVISAEKSEPGYVRAATSNEEISLERFYPAGGVEMQFAFAGPDLRSPVTVSKNVSAGDLLLERVDVHCITSNEQGSF